MVGQMDDGVGQMHDDLTDRLWVVEQRDDGWIYGQRLDIMTNNGWTG